MKNTELMDLIALESFLGDFLSFEGAEPHLGDQSLLKVFKLIGEGVEDVGLPANEAAAAKAIYELDPQAHQERIKLRAVKPKSNVFFRVDRFHLAERL